jgi:hypothetical protein
VVRAAHETGEGALAEPETLEHLGALGFVELRGLGLELHAHAENLDVDVGVVLGQLAPNVVLDLGGPVEIVLAHVADREDGLVRQQEVGRQHVALGGAEPGPVQRHSLGQPLLRRLQRGGLLGE